MSENVFSKGYMAPLVNSMTSTEVELFNEMAYKEGVDLQVNYEGTLIYSNDQTDDPGIAFSSAGMYKDFHNTVNATKCQITHEASFYSCCWYNGSDSHMATLTLNEFLEKNGWI